MPREFAPRVRAVRLGVDVVSLLGVWGCMLLIVGDQATAVRGAAIASSLLLLALWALGGYDRSYAVSARDEAYPVLAAFVACAAAYLVISFVPNAHLDRSLGIGLMAADALLLAAVRIASHVPAGRSARAAVREAEVESPANRFIKRALDVVLTIAILPIAIPICLAVAAVVLLDDGAPVLFTQQRVGRDGVPFRVFKFRTMRRDAGDRWVTRGDRRITRTGAVLRRSSLDELPQLINVLRGEMSLVGPRPEMVAYAEDFARRLPRYSQRHRVKPGITGWAQVTMPRNLDVDDVADVLSKDLFYVDHWSLGFDCMIIAKTAAEVLFHRAV